VKAPRRCARGAQELLHRVLWRVVSNFTSKREAVSKYLAEAVAAKQGAQDLYRSIVDMMSIAHKRARAMAAEQGALHFPLARGRPQCCIQKALNKGI